MGEYDIDARAIAGALETGCMQINDPGLLQALEHTIGRKIKIKVPMNPAMMDSEILLKRMGAKQTPPPSPIEAKKSVDVKVPPSGEKETMPVVRTGLPGWLDRHLSRDEMYKKSVEETDKKIMGSHILQNKRMTTDIELALTKWATPELFEYLSMRGPKAEAELRAAMYPLSVGFSHRVFKSDGRYWITPYITVGIGKNTPSDTNKGLEDIRDCKNSISFYCNKWGEVHAIRGEFVKKYSESDFKNFDEMKKKSIEAIATEKFELRIPFMQPKTGERQYGFVVTEGSEGNIEKRFNHDYKWCQWKDVTSFVDKNGDVGYDDYWGQYPKEEKVRIARKGLESLANIKDELLREDGMIAHHISKGYDCDTETVFDCDRDDYYRDGDELYWCQLD